MLTIGAVGRTGGATVGSMTSSAPFRGVCLSNDPGFGGEYVSPDFCVPVTPNGGLVVNRDLYAPMPDVRYPKRNALMSVGVNLLPANPQGRRFMQKCYDGPQGRFQEEPGPFADCDFDPSCLAITRSFGSFSCSHRVDEDSLWCTNCTIERAWTMAYVPDVEIPAVIPPVLTVGSGRVGQQARLTVTNFPPSAAAHLATTFQGQSVTRFNDVITDANGVATFIGGDWTSSEVGAWTAVASWSGGTSNQLNFAVFPASTPVPAVPSRMLGVLALGFATLGAILSRRPRSRARRTE
ncbi:MAG TPA: hypothetical protein VKQ32_11755 [Polyangia bacterium]|nr:hypothetical protein [Polyangia bacterium]